MADRESTSLPAAENSASSTATPDTKRAKMSSQDPRTEMAQETEKTTSSGPDVAEPEQVEDDASPIAAEEIDTHHLAGADDTLEADDGYADSALGTERNSDITSVSSSIYKGYVENGRRYQTLREGEYWGPSDEKQFESMMAAHIVYLILESKQKNDLFRSPISENAQNILDVGTGNGEWCRSVADKFPGAVVTGVDLYPPPITYVPPNCQFIVEDCLKPWVYSVKFDLIHLRDLHGSFTDRQWTGVYKQAYDNLLPGGWIEAVDAGVWAYCDDGTVPKDSLLAKSGELFDGAAEKMGKPADSIFKSKARIEAAGFTNIKEVWYKVPIGDWTKSPLLKEAGRFTKTQMLEGLEGYALFILTHYGVPENWTPEEVHVWIALMRKDLSNPAYHAYCLKRRVYAQKPVNG